MIRCDLCGLYGCECEALAEQKATIPYVPQHTTIETRAQKLSEILYEKFESYFDKCFEASDLRQDEIEVIRRALELLPAKLEIGGYKSN